MWKRGDPCSFQRTPKSFTFFSYLYEQRLRGKYPGAVASFSFVQFRKISFFSAHSNTVRTSPYIKRNNLCNSDVANVIHWLQNGNMGRECTDSLGKEMAEWACCISATLVSGAIPNS